MPRCRCTQECKQELKREDRVVEVQFFGTGRMPAYVLLDHIVHPPKAPPAEKVEEGNPGNGG